MHGHAPPAVRVPRWIHKLAVPVWISGPDRGMVAMNRHALDLVECPAAACIGRPCHEVIRGRDENLRPFCSATCPLRLRVESAGELDPEPLCITAPSGQEHWFQVMAFPLRVPDSDGLALIHCALPWDRSHRLETYMRRVTHRSPTQAHPDRRLASLTAREREVLDLLARDETLYGIAERLSLSHATVRNHVQHILEKLQVHSVMEAVAWWLLEDR